MQRHSLRESRRLRWLFREQARSHRAVHVFLTVSYTRQDTKHFVEQVGAQQGGVACGVVRWRDFHQIATDQIQTLATTDDLDALNGGQAANFRGAGAWRPGRVDTVDIETQ